MNWNLLTEQKVAERLNCTASALRRWRREGRGPRFIKVERLVRYRQEEVENFLAANTHGVVVEVVGRTERRNDV